MVLLIINLNIHISRGNEFSSILCPPDTWWRLADNFSFENDGLAISCEDTIQKLTLEQNLRSDEFVMRNNLVSRLRGLRHSSKSVAGNNAELILFSRCERSDCVLTLVD